MIKRSRILTDLSGRFDTVVVESEVESIDAYFAFLHAAFADPEFQAAQAALVDSPYQSGQRNFYTIEATYEVEVYNETVLEQRGSPFYGGGDSSEEWR